jgi:FkbM family methyltransferase
MVQTQEKHWNTTINEWSNEDYFKHVVNILKEKNIKTIIDIGANVGGVAEILLNNISSIEKVYLFEPQINNFNYMFKKLKNNKKVIFLNCGIYYGHHHLKIMNYAQHDHVGAYTVVEDVNKINSYKEPQIEFQLFELEFFNFGNVDFIKIDIEGGEYNIIEHSSFLQTVNFIEIEVHDKFNADYFKKYFPNHSIILDGYYQDYNNISHLNHIFLQKKK